MINASGSDWVRVGNTASSTGRSASIYITTNDTNGPYIDVYDMVTSSLEATSGLGGNVNTGKTKVRLGKLTGITDNTFGGSLSGYGLYSDNVYLKGNISASNGSFRGTISSLAGNIGGWVIN